MSEFDKNMQAIANMKDLTVNKAKEILTEFYPFIVAIASIVFTVVSQLFEYGLENPFSFAFWVSLGRNILTTTAAYLVFVNHGNSMYKITNTAYRQNLKTWGELSCTIRTTTPSEFIEYCKQYIRNAVEDNRRAILERYSLVSWNDFNENYRKKTKAEILDFVKSGKISARDGKAILKAQKPIKPAKIEPVAILCGSDTVKVEAISTQRVSYSMRSVLFRPLVMVGINVGLALLSSSKLSMNTAAVWFDIVTSSFMIMLACIMGDLSGDGAARKDHAAVKSKIFFINGFMQK